MVGECTNNELDTHRLFPGMLMSLIVITALNFVLSFKVEGKRRAITEAIPAQSMRKIRGLRIKRTIFLLQAEMSL